MRNYPILHEDTNFSKGTSAFIAVLHFTVTVGSSILSISDILR